MRRLSLLVLVAGLCFTACSKKSSPPAQASVGGDDAGLSSGLDAGGSGGSGGSSGSSSKDDGGVSEDDGGGPLSGGTCRAVDPGAYTNEDVMPNDRGSGVTAPTDLVVTRGVIGWEGSCDKPTLVVKLSSGHCTLGDGHEIDFMFSGKAIDDGLITQGQNNVLAEPDSRGIKIRYLRPTRLPPSGSWGTCSGVSGQLVFPDAPSVAHHGALKGRFLLDLAACDGKKTGSQTLNGWFNLQLTQTLAEFCAKGG